jgi:hypothetical protein
MVIVIKPTPIKFVTVTGTVTPPGAVVAFVIKPIEEMGAFTECEVRKQIKVNVNREIVNRDFKSETHDAQQDARCRMPEAQNSMLIR